MGPASPVPHTYHQGPPQKLDKNWLLLNLDSKSIDIKHYRVYFLKGQHQWTRLQEPEKHPNT